MSVWGVGFVARTSEALDHGSSRVDQRHFLAAILKSARIVYDRHPGWYEGGEHCVVFGEHDVLSRADCSTARELHVDAGLCGKAQ